MQVFVGPKGEEVTGGWRRLHNEESRNLYSSPDIIMVTKSRRMRWAKHAARVGEIRNAYKILVGKPEGKGPLGTPRRRGDIKAKVKLSLCLTKHKAMKAHWGMEA
jgi:hypothetical protein